MNHHLHLIGKKIGDMQVGLMRFRKKGGQLTLEVRTTLTDDQVLNCIVTSDNVSEPLINRKVRLILENPYDYLYITGRISEEVQEPSKMVSLSITKARWFTFKMKGNATWLQEKYNYENENRSKAS